MVHLSRREVDQLTERIRRVRVECCGEGDAGIAALAAALDVPPRTWTNFEAGVAVPSLLLLKFLDQTGADPHYLLTGEGPHYLPTHGRFGA